MSNDDGDLSLHRELCNTDWPIELVTVYIIFTRSFLSFRGILPAFAFKFFLLPFTLTLDGFVQAELL
jgi:hypothetical protein